MRLHSQVKFIAISAIFTWVLLAGRLCLHRDGHSQLQAALAVMDDLNTAINLAYVLRLPQKWPKVHFAIAHQTICISTGLRERHFHTTGIGNADHCNHHRNRALSLINRGGFMPERIKCGVIGAGWWATYAHIPALLSHPAAELIAIQKRDPSQARRVADDFGIPLACTAVAELLAIEDLQAVVVSSSPNLHYDHAHAALTLGKHVLIEKPMTMTATEAAQLVDLAHERDVQFLISCPWHYTSHAAAARRLVRGGYLGKMRMISVLMTNPISHLLRGTSNEVTHGTPYMQPAAGTYSDPAIAGGGQIYAQVCHVAAYLAFLTGARPSEVFARFHNDGEAVDIYDVINLEMSDGAIVSIASTGATNLNRRDYEIRLYGTDGMLFLDLWRGHMEFVPMSGEPRRYTDLPTSEIYPEWAPASNLIDSILDPARNLSPAILGQAAMEVIEGACQSAETGKNISVPGGVCETV